MRTAMVYPRVIGIASRPCWAWVLDNGEWRIGSHRAEPSVDDGLGVVLDVLAATSGALEIGCVDGRIAALIAGDAAVEGGSRLVARVRAAVAERGVRVSRADPSDIEEGLRLPMTGAIRLCAPASSELRAAIIAQETALLGADARRDPARLEQLIHPDFDEIGRTGKDWEREEVIRVLQTVPDQTESIDFGRVIELAPGVAHVTFRTTDDRGTVRRSSIWLQEEGMWRQRYHQGTPDTQQ